MTGRIIKRMVGIRRIMPPVRTAMAVLAIAFIVWECIDTPPRTIEQLAITALQIVFVALTPRLPRSAGAALLVLDFCRTAVKVTGGPTTAAGMLLATGLLAYEAPTAPWMIGVYGAAAMSQIAQQVLFSSDDMALMPLFPVLVTLLLCTVAGGAVRVRERAHQERLQTQRTQDALHTARECTRLANAIHDGTVGELSLIVRIAQRRLSQPCDDVDADAWRQVLDCARTALTDTRQVITQLDGVSAARLPQDATASSEDGDMFERRLRTMVQGRDAGLHAAGLHGAGVVNVAPEATFSDDAGRQLVLDAVTELYANIVRHGEPNEEYDMSVFVGPATATIVTRNTVRDSGEMAAGRGLAQLGKRIRRRGGSMETETHGAEWMCFMRIPL